MQKFAKAYKAEITVNFREPSLGKRSTETILRKKQLHKLEKMKAIETSCLHMPRLSETFPVTFRKHDFHAVLPDECDKAGEANWKFWRLERGKRTKKTWCLAHESSRNFPSQDGGPGGKISNCHVQIATKLFFKYRWSTLVMAIVVCCC